MKSFASNLKFRIGGLILVVGLVLALGLFIHSTQMENVSLPDSSDAPALANGTSSTGGNPGRRQGTFDPFRSDYRDRLHQGRDHDHFNKDTHGNIPGKPSQVLPGTKGSDS